MIARLVEYVLVTYPGRTLVNKYALPRFLTGMAANALNRTFPLNLYL